MKSKRRVRLFCEELESRWCPSIAVKYAAGSLTLTGTTNTTPTTSNLLITETGPNMFSVQDGTGNPTLGTYNVTGNITLSLTREASGIDVELGGFSLAGNLLMSLGAGTGGTDSVTVAGGTVNGSVTITGGNGNETYNLGLLTGPAPLVVGGTVLVSGVSSGISGNFVVVDGNSALQKDLVTSAVDAVRVSAGSSVGGSLTMSDSTGLGPANLAVVGNVGQNVTVLGPLAGSLLSIGDGTTVGTISGSLVFSMKGGANNIALSANYEVVGSATITTGAGDDAFTLSGTIDGSLALKMGDGSNSLVFNTAAVVSGNMSITGGNGVNDLGGGGLGGLFQGTVGGNLTISLGNGTNNFNFGTIVVPGAGGTLNPALLTGSTLSYTGGAGNDSVVISGANNFALNVNLGGGGTDSFAYGNVLPTTVGSATIDFGLHVGTDVFDDGGNSITWRQVLRHFP